MDAAVYGIPALFGPVNENASEAKKLTVAGGAKIVTDSDEIEEFLTSLLNDKNLITEMGIKAQNFSKLHSGASDKLIKEWQDLLF